jgi:hypothetical protein
MRFSRLFLTIPPEDTAAIQAQTPSVQKLWLQSWESDPYGSRWIPIVTNLAQSTFRVARKILSLLGLFKFRAVKDENDARKTKRWEVLNLHGSRVKNFWQKSAENEANNDPIQANNDSIQANNDSIQAANLSETLETSSFTESVKNSSETHQQHLIDVVDVCYQTQPTEEAEFDKQECSDLFEPKNPRLAFLKDRIASLIKGVEISPNEKVKRAFSRFNWIPSQGRIDHFNNLPEGERSTRFGKFSSVMKSSINPQVVNIENIFDKVFGYEAPSAEKRDKQEYINRQKQLAREIREGIVST